MKTKLDRLTKLEDVLLKCKIESVKDADEWKIYHDISSLVKGLILDEQRLQGWCAVREIGSVDADDHLFVGDKDECKTYTDILLQSHPEYRNNIIISPL